jgi:hypothetical protein
MAFNILKCKVIHLGHGTLQHSYMMSGQAPGTTEEEKDIGVSVS